jgi:Tol biopolymer transport system component
MARAASFDREVIAMLMEMLTFVPSRYLAPTMVVLASLLLAFTVGGCGGEGTPAAVARTSQSAATTVSEAADGGGRIAYACGDPPQICVINEDGTGMRQLTHGGYHQSPAWSPDGTLLAFTGSATVPGEEQIYVTKADGGAAAQVTHGGGNKASADWSPNGLVLVAADDRGGDFDLYLFDPSGQVREKRLTRGPAEDIDPDWSPDGTSVVFSRVKGRSFPTVMVVRRDGKDTFRVIPGLDPAWSPDESQLAVATVDGIVLVAGHGKPTLLTDHPFDTEPSWSPDGSRLAFRRGRANEDAEIFVVNSDGTGLRQLTRGSGTDVLPAWSPR